MIWTHDHVAAADAHAKRQTNAAPLSKAEVDRRNAGKIVKWCQGCQRLQSGKAEDVMAHLEWCDRKL